MQKFNFIKIEYTFSALRWPKFTGWVVVCHSTRRLLLKPFLLCWLKSNFNEAKCDWCDDKLLQSYWADFEYLRGL